MFRKPKSKSSNYGSRESLDSRQSSGKSPYSSSENVKEISVLNRTSTYTVSFIGVLEHVTIPPTTSDQSQAALLESVENAQIEGKLPVIIKEDVNLIISRHGIRITALPTANLIEEVKWRFPLHTIGQVMTYESATGKFNLIVTIGQVGKFIFDCHVLQCQTQEQSQAICNGIQSIFNTLTQS